MAVADTVGQRACPALFPIVFYIACIPQITFSNFFLKQRFENAEILKQIQKMLEMFSMRTVIKRVNISDQ